MQKKVQVIRITIERVKSFLLARSGHLLFVYIREYFISLFPLLFLNRAFTSKQRSQRENLASSRKDQGQVEGASNDDQRMSRSKRFESPLVFFAINKTRFSTKSAGPREWCSVS